MKKLSIALSILLVANTVQAGKKEAINKMSNMINNLCEKYWENNPLMITSCTKNQWDAVNQIGKLISRKDTELDKIIRQCEREKQPNYVAIINCTHVKNNQRRF